MKKIFFVILFCPLISFAQEWHSVPFGQHNIYKVEVSGVDSFWNNYVRNIYVEDSVIHTDGIQYNFYRSLRKDKNELLDTTNGPTWLGRFVFRENNGDEVFLNKYLDTIRIKTLATLNQSWTLGSDTAGTKLFEATITSLDTMTIDGILDSIKTIGIQAFQGTTTINSIFNNYDIVISKKYGFINSIDFYGFPEYENAKLLSNTSILPYAYDSMDVYPILPYLHSRLDSSITHRKYNEVDLQYQYQPGNEWITKAKYYDDDYYYDSIISVNTISADTIIITVKRDSLIWKVVSQAPISRGRVYSSGIYTDTIIKVSKSATLKTDSVERQGYSSAPHSNISPDLNAHIISWRFLETNCNGKLLIKDTFSTSTGVSGYKRHSKKYYEDTNFDIFYRKEFMGFGQANYNETKLVYYKFAGCTGGKFYALTPIAVNDYSSINNQFKLYPNPTTNSFYIETDKKWNSIEVLSIDGQVVKSFSSSQASNLTIDELSNGLYLIRIRTNKGDYIQKLLKE